jgi:hypothetical protein
MPLSKINTNSVANTAALSVGTLTSSGAILSTSGAVTANGTGFDSAVYLNNTGTGGKNWVAFSTNNAFSQGGGKFMVYHNDASSSWQLGVDSAGRVTTPLQPSFMAVVGTEVSLTGGAENVLTTAFTSTTYNVGSHFNTANGRFTAPVAGLYHFVADLYVYTCSTVEIYFKINGSTYIRTWDKPQGLNVNPSGNRATYQVYLSASDYVTLAAVPNQTAALWNGGPYSSRFTGCLLG